MGLNKSDKFEGTYVSILADGKLHVAAKEGDEGAVKREYETSDGVKGEKWEHQYADISGMITKVAFFEGKFGTSLNVSIKDENDTEYILSTGASSKFGEDIMKKLPNVDMKKPVKFAPYAFEDEKTGKKRQGVTVYQDDVKLTNFYYNATTKKNVNGYPDFPKDISKLLKEGKKVPTAKWKLYFGAANQFLIEDLTERLGLETEESEEKDKDAELDEMVEDAKKALD
jgi:hypothetical protein